MKGRVIGSADSNLVACLPFTQMQNSFFAEKERGQGAEKDDDKGEMSQHQSPFATFQVLVFEGGRDEVDDQKELEQEKQGGIINHCFGCRCTVILFDESGNGQAKGINL